MPLRGEHSCRQHALQSDPAHPVLVPGEPERLQRARRMAEGIEVDATTWRDIEDAAKSVGTTYDAP